MAVTMNEIAKKLNISIATVSRALSGKADTVSESTKKAVFDAVERYGYKKRKNIGKSVAFVITPVPEFIAKLVVSFTK